MSTKIYAAFVWTGPGGMRQVLDNIMLMRGLVRERAIKNILANDEMCRGLEHRPMNYRSLTDKLAETMRSPYRDELNFASTVSVYPGDDGKIYAVFHGLDSLAFGNDSPECFVDSALWSDYHYQDSADGPDSISDDDWDLRRRTWESIFERPGMKASTFGEAGLTYTFIDAADAMSLIYAAGAISRKSLGA